MENLKFREIDGELTLCVRGELDHCLASSLRGRIDATIEEKRPKTAVLDISGVSFMDSSGVGFVLGRCKKAASVGAKTAVRGLSPRDERMMRFSGLPELVEFREGRKEA